MEEKRKEKAAIEEDYEEEEEATRKDPAPEKRLGRPKGTTKRGQIIANRKTKKGGNITDYFKRREVLRGGGDEPERTGPREGILNEIKMENKMKRDGEFRDPRKKDELNKDPVEPGEESHEI